MRFLAEKRSAAIVSLSENLKEIEDLARSAEYEVVFELIQMRRHADPKTFIGKGRAADLLGILKQRHVDVVLFNGDLKPSQHFNLERLLGLECIDRVRLVLNIFKERASTAESKLQVERATLKYEIPFLREWIHNAKSGERPGFLAGGGYAVDVYYDLIRKRMKVIDDELLRLGKGSTLRREQRRKKECRLVCLAGYTNAGKSSLLNRLTGENVLVDDRLFSTLSARTRRIEDITGVVLLTDTIGFLEDLPYFMIESFKHTLDEIFFADIILLVLDSSNSEDELLRKMESCSRILYPQVDPSRVIIVLNKIDLVDSGLERKVQLVMDAVMSGETILVSAKSGEGIENLIEAIKRRFRDECEMEVVLPNTSDVGRWVSRLCEIGSIRRIDYDDEVRLTVACTNVNRERIVEIVRKQGGRIIGKRE